MATTPTGLDIPAGTDPFDPDGDIRVLAGSLEPRVVVPVPNVTARDALATAVTPTPGEPLYTHRADAPAGRRLEVNDGGGFRSVSPAGGLAVGALNQFGQIVIPHGLGYTPTMVTATLGGNIIDASVSEDMPRDYAATIYSVGPEDFIVRITNIRTTTWAGLGLRVAVLWTAR